MKTETENQASQQSDWDLASLKKIGVAIIGFAVFFGLFVLIAVNNQGPARPASASAAAPDYYGHGYSAGLAAGEVWAKQRRGIPTSGDLDRAAEGGAKSAGYSGNDAEQFRRGLRAGFEEGYKKIAAPAFK